MGTRIIDGRDSTLVTVKNRGGSEKLVKEYVYDAGKPAEQTTCDTEDMVVSMGRTISLGNYEFSKVNVGIKIGLLDSSEAVRDQTYALMLQGVKCILDREEADVRGQKSLELKFPPLDGIGVKRSVWLEYGLTIKGGGMDSFKVDVALSRHVSDTDSIEKTILELSEEIGVRIGVEADDIRNPEKRT